MADRLVVGIFPTCDPQELQNALASQPAIDTSKLRVVTPQPRTDEHEESDLHFIHVIEEEAELDRDSRLTHDTGIISDFGGTGVPGINWNSSLSQFYSGGGTNLLIDTGIPQDEAGNFGEAMDQGRCVVVYNAGDETGSVVEAFRAAGLTNVHAV